MSSVNKVFILGRLGKDPEIRYTSDGKPIASFSVATSTYGKDANGNKTEFTEWHRISAFSKAAEVVDKYVKKGDLIHIEGSLRTKKWVDSHGQEKYGTDIVVGRLNLLGSKQGGSEAPPPAVEGGSNFEDDMPF
jgi:single-strand DNA-binding protein